MKEKKITIALAGNSNIGKSVIFNYLTGLNQHIGNWPGKTVEKAEGTLHFKGYTIDIIDLPGIYSLSSFSLEEIITREYIINEKPDLIINVVDASVLERNLFFTIQLMELKTPMIIALNQMDIAKKRGIKIDHKKLQDLLGVPVVPTIATKGLGLYELLEKSIDVIEKKVRTKPKQIKYGEKIEEKIEKLTSSIEKLKIKYPARWAAIKLLDNDKEIKKFFEDKDPKLVSLAEKYSKEIKEFYSNSCPTSIACEKYSIAYNIAHKVQKIKPLEKPRISDKIHELTTHKILGYPIMLTLLLLIFLTIFSFGDFLSGILNEILLETPVFEEMFGTGLVSEILFGAFEGLVAGITIVLPYILPFYIILGILEDSGYLSRIAFLTDKLMHKIGLHGKAFIPIMLGYGCNVPACLGCRIMETQRERLIAIFVTTLIPCAAVTAVILGLVGKFVGIGWALLLYVIDLIIIFILGRIAFKALPGEPTELIMEMHPYRIPHFKTMMKQTWFRIKEFIYIAFPLIILGSLVIKILEVAGLFDLIVNVMSPITVNWLGLPAIAGVALIFGILRKELTLMMLATVFGTSNFLLVLTPVQMLVFSLVTMLYIPCIATVAALVKETGWKKATFITLFEIGFAILAGGIFLRILLIFV